MHPETLAMIRYIVFCLAVLVNLASPLPCAGNELPLLDYEGYQQLLEENRGKVVVVDFWATWCGPCRKKLPELDKCRRSFSEAKMTMVGISLDFNPDTLRDFLEKSPLSYPVYWAEENLAAALEVQAIPLLLIYDPQGDLVQVDEGLTPHENLCSTINDQLLP